MASHVYHWVWTGSYQWHYDRNAVTAIIYLNAPQGGETIVWPLYRFPIHWFTGESAAFSSGSYWYYKTDQLLWNRHIKWWLAPLLWGSTKKVVRPKPGRILVMNGNRCLHCVSEQRGPGERINLIMSFGKPGASYKQAAGLDSYIYKPENFAGNGNYTSTVLESG